MEATDKEGKQGGSGCAEGQRCSHQILKRVRNAQTQLRSLSCMHRNQAHVRQYTVKTAARCRRRTRHGQVALALVSPVKHVEERYDNPFEVTSLRGWRAFSLGPDANLCEAERGNASGTCQV